MSYVTLEDGTRKYSGRGKYRPVPPDQRKRAVRKPDDPSAILWKGRWYTIPPFLELAARTMPATRPDSEAKGHPRRCRCTVCKRPERKLY